MAKSFRADSRDSVEDNRDVATRKRWAIEQMRRHLHQAYTSPTDEDFQAHIGAASRLHAEAAKMGV